MGPTVSDIQSALSKVPFPGFSRDIVSLGTVRDIRVDGGRVQFEIAVDPPNPELAAHIEQAARAAVEDLPGVTSVDVRVHGADASPSLRVVGSAPASAAAEGSRSNDLVPDVKRIIAVASGKGGVGKSTVAVNLAVALARMGRRVGLLDADVYGPSIPLMMGNLRAEPRVDQKAQKMAPFERLGIRFMSLGFLVDPDSAVIWRGPMVMKALVELLGNVAWGALDVLVVDMPPGTGDAQLTLSQRVSLAGAVIVTTPQDVALADAIKGVAMFRKVDVPVLGLVENMSYFVCPHCTERSEIFGHGGGRREAKRLGVPFLGEIPLDPAIRTAGDVGEPIVAAEPDSPQAQAFLAIAEQIVDEPQPVAPDEGTKGTSIFDRFRRIRGGSSD